MTMICTMYSHMLTFEAIIAMLQEIYPDEEIATSEDGDSKFIILTLPDFGRLTIKYRERALPSYFLPDEDDSELTSQLKGLYGFVASFPAENEEVKDLFLQKITTINSEFSLQLEGEIPALAELIEALALTFEAFIFMQPGMPISQSDQQHFLNEELQLIIDPEGNTQIDTLEVNISKEIYEAYQ